MAQKHWQLWLPEDSSEEGLAPKRWQKNRFGRFDRPITLAPSELQRLRQDLEALMLKQQTVALLPYHPIKAIFFDVDATAIREESMDVLAGLANKEKEVAAITRQGMTGAISFATSLRRRLEILKGLPLSLVEQTNRQLTMNPGLEEFCRQAKDRKIAIYLVSGGFDFFVEPLVQELGADGFLANRWLVRDGALQDAWDGPLIDSEAKAQFVQEICVKKGWQRWDIAVVGDGFNDRLMMNASDFAIGFQPKNQLIPHLHAANFSGDHGWLIDLLLTHS